MSSIFSTRLARRGVRAVAILAVATILGAGAASPALATPSPTASQLGKLLLVLDASGSMREPTTSGESRISAATKALTNVISDLPDAQEVGMRVYGATVRAVANTKAAGSCTDSQLVVPIASGNRDALLSAASAYRPIGETPIAYALEEAGKDLGLQGRRQILLLSDGQESCEPSPCPTAEKLASGGTDLTINVVGLNVSGKARDDLQCVARAGNGQYFDAVDAGSLASTLDRAAERRADGFAPSGQRIDGGPDAQSATTLSAGEPDAPAKYVDRLSADAASRFYRVPRTIKDSTVWFSVTGAASASDVRNEPVAKVVGIASSCYTSFPGFFTTLSRQFSNGFIMPPDSEVEGDCATGDEVIVELDPLDLPDVPVEITVIEEPPVASTTSLPYLEAPRKEAVPAGEAKSARWSNSTARAERVDPGNYSVELVGGETQFVAVDVEWGQRIQLTLRRAAGQQMNSYAVVIPPTGGQAAFRYDGVGVDSLSPDRDVAVTTTAAAAYLNRTAGEGREPYLPMSMAGRYYVGVTADVDDTGEAMTVQSGALQIDVLGEAVGEPEYLVEPIAGSADGAQQSGSLPPWILMVLGGIALLILGALVAWLVLRRQPAAERRYRSTYREPKVPKSDAVSSGGRVILEAQKQHGRRAKAPAGRSR